MRQLLSARWLLRVVRRDVSNGTDLPDRMPSPSRIPACGSVWFARVFGPFAELRLLPPDIEREFACTGTSIGVRVNIDLSLGYGLRSISVRVFPLASGSTFGDLLNHPFPPQVSLQRVSLSPRILFSNLSEKQLIPSIYMQIQST